MKITFVPKICKDDGEKLAPYSGSIEIEVPKAPERHRYIRESGLAAVMEKLDGKPGSEKVAIDLVGQFDMVTNLMGHVEKHVTKVDLVRKEDGLKVDSVDALMSIASCESVIMEICGMFIRGFEPGKNLGA